MECRHGAARPLHKRLIMPSLSPAFRRFETRLAEVHHLIVLSQHKVSGRRLKLATDEHSAALCRAATVLLSSHIQGFVEDLSDVVVKSFINDSVPAAKIPDAFRYFASKNAIISIVSTQGAQTVERIRTYLSDFGYLIETTGPAHPELSSLPYKDGFGNPTVDEVKQFLKRFGFTNFEGEMKRRLKRDWLLVENAVDQTVDRRNKIAHGDPLATLTPSELKQYMSLVRKFCATADAVTTMHFRKVGCRI